MNSNSSNSVSRLPPPSLPTIPEEDEAAAASLCTRESKIAEQVAKTRRTDQVGAARPRVVIPWTPDASALHRSRAPKPTGLSSSSLTERANAALDVVDGAMRDVFGPSAHAARSLKVTPPIRQHLIHSLLLRLVPSKDAIGLQGLEGERGASLAASLTSMREDLCAAVHETGSAGRKGSAHDIKTAIKIIDDLLEDEAVAERARLATVFLDRLRRDSFGPLAHTFAKRADTEPLLNKQLHTLLDRVMLTDYLAAGLEKSNGDINVFLKSFLTTLKNCLEAAMSRVRAPAPLSARTAGKLEDYISMVDGLLGVLNANPWAGSEV